MDTDLRYIVERIDGLRNRVDRVINLLTQSSQEGSFLSQFIALRDAVIRNSNAVESALVLINGLSAKLKEVQTPEDLSDLIKELDADAGELSSAVAANTPAAPENPNPTPANPNPEPVPVDPVPQDPIPAPTDPSPTNPVDGTPPIDLTDPGISRPDDTQR